MLSGNQVSSMQRLWKKSYRSDYTLMKRWNDVIEMWQITEPNTIDRNKKDSNLRNEDTFDQV